MLTQSQYFYYCVVGLGYRVHPTIKRSLTTAQICQFLVGSTFASAHLFVSYAIPVAVPYTFKGIAEDLPSIVSSAAASATSVLNNSDPTSTLSSLAAEATKEGGAWLKKLVYRAGGSPALAENVRNHNRQTFGTPLHNPIVHSDLKRDIEEIRYRNEWQEVHCLDTSGQAFAIWLNVLYLAPLTMLFVRFFWKTYITGQPPKYPKGKDGKATKPRQLSESVEQAARDTYNAVENMGKQIEGEADVPAEKIENAGKQIKKEYKEGHFDEKASKLKKDMEDFAKGMMGNKDAGEKVEEQEEKTETKSQQESKPQQKGVSSENAKPKSASSSENAKPKASIDVTIKHEGEDEPAYAKVVAETDSQDAGSSTASLKQNGSGTPSTPGTPSGKKHKSPKKKHPAPAPTSS
jgi:hypothetical protein